MKPRAHFLGLFRLYVRRTEWITSADLARRLSPHGGISWGRYVSQKLSNLNRFGHLERRYSACGTKFEYALSGTAVDSDLPLPP